jgi:glycosyltransferase involved in cell wall biosynthesis
LGLRIDLVTPRFHPSVGGIEESVRQTARGLSARGHEPTIHTMLLGGEETETTVDGVVVRRYKPVVNRGYYASRFEPDLRGDVVHLNAYAHQTNDWVIERHAGRVPIFYSTHHGARFPKDRLLAKFYHAVYNRTRGFRNLARTTGVFVPTGYDATYFAEHGVPRQKIHLVPSGADERLFGSIPPRAPQGVVGAFVLFMGRLHREKGVLDLLTAHARMPTAPPLVLVGRDEGALHGISLEELARRNVHVVKDAADDERFGFLAACSLLVLPSHYEGQGIVLIEAWAQRKPVVGTRAGAVPFVVDDGKEGLLVPAKDPDALAAAMERLLRDPRFAAQLAEAGRRKAETFYRWPRIVDAIERHYLSAVGNDRRT